MIGTRDITSKEVVEWVRKHWRVGKQLSENESVRKLLPGLSCLQRVNVIILCTSCGGSPTAIKIMGPSNFVGKIVIDTTDPLNFKRISHHGSKEQTSYSDFLDALRLACKMYKIS